MQTHSNPMRVNQAWAINPPQKETTLVVRTNISLTDGNFLNWNTDSPWIS